MKKIILSTALAVCSGMFLASCEDMLDVEQKATSSTETFYKTDADAESAVTAMYSTYTSEIAGTEGIWNALIMGLNYSADDVFSAGGGTDDHADFRILDEFRYDASSGPISTLYNHIYMSIYSANLVINYFGGDKANSAVKKQAVAEARTMRAWAHLMAALVYNCPPLVDHLIIDDKPTNAESQKQILDWCVAECEASIADLPERKSQDDKEGAWRATKGFAQFVAGKAALFAGDYAKCAEVIKPLVESNKYALVDGTEYRNLFHVEGDGCKEKIFEFNFISNKAVGGDWGFSRGRGRWMVSNVLNWRGDDIVGGGKSPLICSTGGWGGGSINQDFAHKMLANDGDSYRRKATFLTSDEFFYDETLCGWVSDATCTTREQKEMDPDRGIKNSNGSFSRSDVMEVKMMMHPNDNDASQGLGDNANNTNFCLARLAEAYLIYAEACIQNGNQAEALKYINKIQDRAGIPAENKAKTATMEVLKDEKQFELWFEGCRWNDIVRWGDAAACYEKSLDNIPYQFDAYFVDKTAEGGYKNVYEKEFTAEQRAIVDECFGKKHQLLYVVRHPWKAANVNLKFQKKHEYWPIPQGVLEVNDQMHQVGGWAAE